MYRKSSIWPSTLRVLRQILGGPFFLEDSRDTLTTLFRAATSVMIWKRRAKAGPGGGSRKRKIGPTDLMRDLLLVIKKTWPKPMLVHAAWTSGTWLIVVVVYHPL